MEFNLYHTCLKVSVLETLLGHMLAIADEQALYLLEFVESSDGENEIKKLKIKSRFPITLGTTAPIISINKELTAYFEGELTQFQTKLHLAGSPFQRSVWEELQKIPYGQTRSYLKHAQAIGKETACRAVGNANGANRIAIVVPCHRVINNNGDLGGYKTGIMRKNWLLAHERKHKI